MRYATRLTSWPTNPPMVAPAKFGWIYVVSYKVPAYDTIRRVKRGWRPTKFGAAYAAMLVHQRYFATAATAFGEQWDSEYWAGSSGNDWFNAYRVVDEHWEKETEDEAVKTLKKTVKELS